MSYINLARALSSITAMPAFSAISPISRATTFPSLILGGELATIMAPNAGLSMTKNS